MLLEIIKVLNGLKIPYAIIGAFAASFYGAIRASIDADAVISLDSQPSAFPALMSELKKTPLKITHNKGGIGDPIFAIINVKDKFGNRVDLLAGIRGMEPDFYSRNNTVTFMAVKFKSSAWKILLP